SRVENPLAFLGDPKGPTTRAEFVAGTSGGGVKKKPGPRSNKTDQQSGDSTKTVILHKSNAKTARGLCLQDYIRTNGSVPKQVCSCDGVQYPFNLSHRYGKSVALQQNKPRKKQLPNNRVFSKLWYNRSVERFRSAFSLQVFMSCARWVLGFFCLSIVVLSNIIATTSVSIQTTASIVTTVMLCMGFISGRRWRHVGSPRAAERPGGQARKGEQWEWFGISVFK
ncbi:hypothetical protein B0H14DRAFT_3675551, partial [Mycena olivaceomarginata]